MNREKNLIFFLIFILLVNCSFDKKTGIWADSEEELIRISELEKKQKEIIETEKLFSSADSYKEEVILKKSIILSSPKQNKSWQMSGLNYHNSLGNIFLPQISNNFLKKKIGKNKFPIMKNISRPLSLNDNIFFSDNNGTIFSIIRTGKLNWKKNIYKNIYKKIYKNLTFAIYKNNIYVADNLGFIYVLNSDTGELLWIKNYGIPFKSKIKVFEEKIYLIDQDNKVICLNILDGSKIWDIFSISSFIKSQNLLSLAITKSGEIIFINSAADLIKANGETGEVYWSSNTSKSLLTSATDFFRTSEVIIDNNQILLSSGSSTLAYNLDSGYLNWDTKISSVGTPIIDKENIFLVTDYGYFVILNKNNGSVISSTYILKILKKKKRNTKVKGFIMGSGKIHSVTLNGYLITSSATSGKVESFKKIGDKIFSEPIITNGNLYILTENYRIFGFN